MSKQWSTANTGTVKFDISLNENGNIAQENDTAAGKKSFSLNNIKSDAEFSDCAKVYTAFVTGIAGGRYDESTGEMVIKKKVIDVEDVEP